MAKSLLSPQVEAILNKAVSAELYASHLYKSLANQMQRVGFFGAQKFFIGESADELEHYQKLADHMNDRGAVANLPGIPAISEKVATLQDAIEFAYDTELQLERDYTAWYKSCDCEVTKQFLLQFLEIQRKSVGEYGDLESRINLVGDDKCGLLMIDKELGE